MTTTSPASTIDLYSDESVLEPYENYRVLRGQGPAVWLDQYGVWAVPRYREVYDALHDHETFSSASGVGLSDELNRVMAGGTIASDPPAHDDLRRVLGRQLTPKALRQHQEFVRAKAAKLVDELIERGSFDAVPHFAQWFPVSLVPDLLGWAESDHTKLLDWAAAGFNALGPMNERTLAGMPVLRSLWGYLDRIATERDLREGSWGANLAAAVDAGEIPAERLPTLLGDFLVPSLDTTVSALASTLWLFGTHPEQWDRVRADHSLIPNAFNEVVRLETPARGFCRLVTADHDLGGVTLPAGSRVFLLYASANRDELRWDDPDTFDAGRRDAAGHLAFGHGIHGCVGQGLARLEAHALLAELAAKVRRIEVAEPTWRRHNTIRGIAALPTTLHR
ncbi:cytochrome P450 [Actinosynnema sp. NPDC047251]|uniref:Cytochrome P450 monooxygenase n=1 Tax=Saccharothrix espanaensis (strain ATCC 51144 / DSM 44229 / JCM 9112 / NBRC 15066 / NRRL 15764) TaxID=1179773 RepID=K0K569_SACES|nr:cytochrome P450 [Saccharothrix espanaensis]CCH32732.1 Cytochrome P450 monooxygenase [Saccharothrix espanaensis DSM 44229]